jgi:hypothetical protein
METAIKFKSQKGLKKHYWFMSSRGKWCIVYYCIVDKEWIAKGESWYGKARACGKTRKQAVERLNFQIDPWD